MYYIPCVIVSHSHSHSQHSGSGEPKSAPFPSLAPVCGSRCRSDVCGVWNGACCKHAAALIVIAFAPQ